MKHPTPPQRTHTRQPRRYPRQYILPILLLGLLFFGSGYYLSTAQAYGRPTPTNQGLISLPDSIHPTQTLRVMSYNVENLFDTIDDAGIRDEDFTPEGNHHWTSTRMYRKLHQIEQVISHIGQERWPAFVALVEVEHTGVMEHLLHQTKLGSKGGYSYRISKGRDSRGINVALLYRPKLFRIKQTTEYPIIFPEDSLRRTRNILHIEGVIGAIPLHIFVCHLPSRRGGASQYKYREEVMRQLRQRTDSIQQEAHGLANILIMGDFNGDPNEPATTEVLGAKLLSTGDSIAESEYPSGQLYNLIPHQPETPGTYCYRGVWSQLDQIILSSALLSPKNPIRYRPNSVQIYAPAYLRKTNSSQPFRTYGGTYYMGGYSDHFPIYADLLIRPLAP